MAEENQGANPPPEQPNQPLPRNYDQVLGVNRASKTRWPELVGVTAEEAEKKIKEEREGIEIQVVPSSSFVTMDFKSPRVRLYVDESHRVTRPPTIG
ncbi:hypothetical protein QN277_025347 [Acacia crassicarpa]|uniref:Subtilisin inhibitor 1 n=1 Tax=Acacia crassicarpa TaxID=499986 RepID=A0AAE1MLB3_9FABA|nr:hypothetical protein QN277_025347 [Acacia crassicarpa]